jgi:GNAT superfamily N-acetyltransferase
MTIVRQAILEDLPLAVEITALVNKIYLDAETDMYKQDSTRIAKEVVQAYIKDGSVGLAFIDEKLAGVIKVKKMKDKGATFNFGMFAVDYPYRGEGIGQLLVDYSEKYAVDNGGNFMQLEILRPINFDDADKGRLKKWYTKIGYHFQEGILFQDVYPQHFHKFKTPVIFDVYVKELRGK